MLFEQVQGNHGSASVGALATWPTEVLCDIAATVPIDRGEASPRAGIDLANLATGLVLATPDGQRVAVELGTVDAGGAACVVSWSDDNGVPPGSLVTAVVLSVVTDDGAIEHDFEGTLTAIAGSDGTLSEAYVEARCGSYATSEFSERCGDWNVDGAGYDSLGLLAELWFRPPSDAPEVDGTFTIQGVGSNCDDGSGDGDDCERIGPVDVLVVELERD
jgi:hypothetical protein